MTKCFAYVKDNDTHRFRKCKYSSHFNIEGRNYCIIHTKLLFNKCAITIQKLWRSYRTRTKINNLYINLPTELQQQVLQHLTANTIFNNKYDKNFVPLINTFLKNKYKNGSVHRNKIVKLFNKYYDILDKDNVSTWYTDSRHKYNYNHYLNQLQPV